ncbi:MAG: hypothetical protein AB7S68_04365 [Polyangiaceae bacterium]
MSPTRLWRILPALAFLSPHLALAEPRAEYADASELNPEPIPHLAETALFARYQHSAEDSPVDISVFEGATSNRVYLGRSVNYCLGLDGYAGGGEPGVSYGATVFALGIGARSQSQDFISLCGGGGFDRLGDTLPFGFKLTPELRAGASFGPVRPLIYVRPSWQLKSDRKRVDEDYPFDDFEAGLWLRFGRQHHYWQELSAAGGLMLGLNYTDRAGVRQLGVSLGFDFAGGL